MSQVNIAAITGKQSSGSQPIVAGGFQAEQLVSELHGRKYTQAYNNNLFYSFAVGQAMTAVGTGMVGHILWNGNSTINVALHQLTVNVSATSASVTSVVLAASTAANQPSAPTGLTAITRSGSTKLFGTASLATTYVAATLAVAPSAIWTVLHNTAAIAITGEDPGAYIDFEGGIILPPFGVLCLATVGATAAAAAVTSAITWEEIAV